MLFRYKLLFALQVLATLLWLTSESRLHAQEKSAGVEDSGYGSSAHSMQLLLKKQFQEELKLDRDQQAKLKEIDDARPTITDRDELWKKSVEWGKAAEKILSPAQLARFKEMSLQAHGISAMTDSVVIETLGIAGDQLERLRAIQSKFGERLKTLSQAERIARFSGMEAEAMNEVVALLTPAQREKYEKMRGTPFKLDLTPPHKAEKRP
jgi:hypothetical protein